MCSPGASVVDALSSCVGMCRGASILPYASTHAQIAQVQVQKEGSEPSGLARLEMERDGASQNVKKTVKLSETK